MHHNSMEEKTIERICKYLLRTLVYVPYVKYRKMYTFTHKIIIFNEVKDEVFSLSAVIVLDRSIDRFIHPSIPSC
jgi:hypothetical protein